MTMLHTKEVSQLDWSNGELLGCFVAFLLKKRSWLGEAGFFRIWLFLIKHRMIKKRFHFRRPQNCLFGKIVVCLETHFHFNSLCLFQKYLNRGSSSSVYTLGFLVVVRSKKTFEWREKMCSFSFKKNPYFV